MNILRMDTVDSTNEEIKRLALAGAQGELAVTAREQTAGKGRLGRSWLSSRDMGLYVSLLIEPVYAENGTLALAAGLAVADTIEAALPVSVQVKWPNDILIHEKKVCGILAETFRARERLCAALGAGVNLYQREFPPELAGKATSLAAESSKPIYQEQVERALLAALVAAIAMWQREGFSPFLGGYREKCCTLGRDVTLHGQCDRQALALDVTEEGMLLVRLASGGLETVTAGEVSLQGYGAHE